MPTMSAVEAAFCRSSSWGALAHRYVVPWSLQGVDLGSDVLEIGAGHGAMANRIMIDTPDVAMTVTDYDPKMVAAAHTRLAHHGGRATVERADAADLPYAAARFDVVVSFLMLHHTVQWEAVLGEAIRVLKPGGHLVGYDLVSTRATRTVHRLDRSPFRLISKGEIAPVLADLPVADSVIRYSAHQQLFRFDIRKSDGLSAGRSSRQAAHADN